jgi:hypothetical protein
MIEDNADLISPPDDAVLWRFIDFTKYVSLLDTSKLYFAQAKKMEDRYEGRLPKRMAELTRSELTRAACLEA